MASFQSGEAWPDISANSASLTHGEDVGAAKVVPLEIGG
jgi:hypothetical protein